MSYRICSIIIACVMIISLSACSWSKDPDALSGVAPSTVAAAPEALNAADAFVYNNSLPLADSFKQMNELRISICSDMYSAVVGFTSSSAWVPVAANKFSLGSDEFLAASYVMEIEPGVTAKKLFKDSGFENIQISPLDVENTWKITAVKKNEDEKKDNYEYTVMYGKESDSYRFTLSINGEPKMLLASCRITGGYGVQVWTPEGTYNILAQDVKEGRFGFIPKTRDSAVEFPETDIYFDPNLITSSFTTDGAEYTFLLANNILYISKDGSNYAIPLK